LLFPFPVSLIVETGKNWEILIFHYNEHNVVTKMRNVIKLFKSSPVQNSILQKIISKEGKSKKQLSLDVKTRWNSLESSVSTFLELLPQIKQALAHKSIDKLYMWDDDESDVKRLQVIRVT